MAFLGDDGVLDDVTDEAVERASQGGQRRMLEPGWYRVALSKDEAEMKSWGVGLRMEFRVTHGDYKDVPLFEYLCVRHASSEQAEQIARAKLKSFAIAAGAKDPSNVTNTDPLYGKPVMAQVFREKQKPDQEQYADEDGCKARIGKFVSVAEWKQEHSDEPTPGVGKAASAKAPQPPPKEQEPPPPDPDDIPF